MKGMSTGVKIERISTKFQLCNTYFFHEEYTRICWRYRLNSVEEVFSFAPIEKRVGRCFWMTLRYNLLNKSCFYFSSR